MRKRHERNTAGFTLVELMIVVSIIGLLASIAVPNFIEMQLRAKRSELPVNLKGISVAEQAYYAEYGNYVNSFGFYPRDLGDLDTKAVAWPASAGGFTVMGWAPDGKVYGTYEAFTIGGYGYDGGDENPPPPPPRDDYDDDYKGDYDGYYDDGYYGPRQFSYDFYILYGYTDVDNDGELAVYTVDSSEYYGEEYGGGAPFNVSGFYYGHDSY